MLLHCHNCNEGLWQCCGFAQNFAQRPRRCRRMDDECMRTSSVRMLSAPSSAAAPQSVAGTSDNARLLQCFWDLSRFEHETRATAGATLLSALVEQQAAHERLHAAQPQPSATCSNLSYACDRLISGMCSSNGSSRQGFAGALVEVRVCVSQVWSLPAWSLSNSDVVFPRPARSLQLLQAFPGALSTDAFLASVHRLVDVSQASNQQVRGQCPT